MGTWGYRLYENDTFCEVVELIRRQAPHSASLEALRAEILEQYRDAPDYVLVREAVAEGLWRLNQHTEQDVAAVQSIIADQTDHAFWAELEADEPYLRHRETEMKRFFDRISRAPTPAERWKPETEGKPALQKGSCFWYKSSGSHYGAVVLEVQKSEQIAYFLIALSEGLSAIPRKQEQVLSAPLYTIAWFPETELFNQKRMHFLGNVMIGKTYTDKYGLQIEPDGTLYMTNFGQSATWKHTFRSLRFPESALNDFV